MASHTTYYIGIDLGTSSAKIALVDRSGSKLAVSGAPYSFLKTNPHFFEQNPEDWMHAIRSALAHLARGYDLSGVAAIGLSAQMPTLVLTDQDGRVAHPAIVWCDNRADAIGLALKKEWGADLYTTSGVIWDGRYLLPMFQWLRQHEPACIPSEYRILSAKDYLYFRLTGHMATDPSTASGFGIYALRSHGFHAPYSERLGVEAHRLPPVHASTCSLGGLLPDAGLPLRTGIPVYLGSADSVAGVLGMGAIEDGDVGMICGTSTAIVAVSSSLLFSGEENYLLTPLALAGKYGLETDILSTGNSIRYFANLFGSTPTALSQALDASPPGAKGLLLYPYLAGGEQGALWEPDLCGEILGLRAYHAKADILRALFEGICFEARRCLDAFARAGVCPRKCILTGPVTEDARFTQLFSDVLGYPLHICDEKEASAVGAAWLSMLGCGAVDLAPLVSSAPAGRVYIPASHEAYALPYRRYLENTQYAKIF